MAFRVRKTGHSGAKHGRGSLNELVRENIRRAQLDEAERRLLADPQRASHLQELKEVVEQLRQESKAKGLDKITEREIDALVQAARKERRKKIKQPAR